MNELLQKHGYKLRQHLEEEGWTRRKLTVVDLDEGQRQALEEGGIEALKAKLSAEGKWTFPALDITQVPAQQRDLLLSRKGKAQASVVAPKGDPDLAQLARRLVDAVQERYNVQLPLLDDADVNLDLLGNQHLIVVGGSHQNRIALELALRFQTFFVDASVPGDEGWIVTTHTGLNADGYNVAQLTAPAAAHEVALQTVLDHLQSLGDDVILRYVHVINPGNVMQAHFPTWESWASRLPRRLPQLAGQQVDVDPNDIEGLADILGIGLDSGGVEKNLYNTATIDIAVASARYYLLSADPRALQLFRALLYRIADYYLKTPEGASYPADLDFRLGHLILYYARLEHLEVFNDEDRLILVNLLLACTRSIHEYALKIWPVKPGTPTRHNHESFPARSLLFASDYFKRYGITDISTWHIYIDLVLGEDLWKRFKQKENAWGYEPRVFEHGISYQTMAGRRLSEVALASLRKVVHRQIATTDNFLRAVDYGDTNVSMRPADSMLARILAIYDREGVVPWYAEEGFARDPSLEFQSNPMDAFPGIRQKRRKTPSTSGDWELAPLDPGFLADYDPEFPAAYAFDKLAFRSGWQESDHYLLVEGVGNQTISHAHNDVNGIVRLNHLGRHWIVSNGYGRRVGITNVAQSFSTRVLGPEDHNMLVLHRSGEIVRNLPVCSALLQKGRSGDFVYATGAVLAYGGVNWFRTLLLLANEYLVVVDRIDVQEPGLDSAHVEWNGLGDVTAQGKGFRLEQQGVYMDVTSDSGWTCEHTVADQSASWKGVLDGGAYPYASFPLRKLVFHMPSTAAGTTHTLATLLAATPAEARYSVTQPEAGLVVIEGPASARSLEIQDGDLSVRVEGARAEIRFAPVPTVPEELTQWAATRQ